MEFDPLLLDAGPQRRILPLRAGGIEVENLDMFGRHARRPLQQGRQHPRRHDIARADDVHHRRCALNRVCGKHAQQIGDDDDEIEFCPARQGRRRLLRDVHEREEDRNRADRQQVGKRDRLHQQDDRKEHEIFGRMIKRIDWLGETPPQQIIGNPEKGLQLPERRIRISTETCCFSTTSNARSFTTPFRILQE